MIRCLISANIIIHLPKIRKRQKSLKKNTKSLQMRGEKPIIQKTEREETKALLKSYIEQREKLKKAGEWDD